MYRTLSSHLYLTKNSITRSTLLPFEANYRIPPPSLDNYNWHRFRGDKQRRSAELIISAISQLINDGDDAEIEDLLNQAILWIKEEIKDTGCKSH